LATVILHDQDVVDHLRATILKAAEWVISAEWSIVYLNFKESSREGANRSEAHSV